MNTGKKSVLAIDFGASSGRAVLGHLEDGKITMEEVHRFSNDPVILGDTMYWDTLRQLFEIKQSLVKANNKGGFESVGVDTWGVDFGLLNEHGELLENAVHYRDERTEGMQETVFSAMSKEKLYEQTGIQVENFNSIFQFAALVNKRPWLIGRADKMLLTPDLFNYFLSGEMKAEYTIASTTQLMDARNRVWDEAVMKALNIPTKLFPPIVPSGTVVGKIKEEICQELGVHAAKVVAVTSHDTQSASVAVPAKERDFIFISCGTWSVFGTELDEPLINETTLKCNMSNEGGYGNRNTLLKNIIGLWLIQESRRQWIREGEEYSFGELEKLAGEAKPFVSFIDPDAPEFTPAGNMPERIRAFCERTGQPVPQTIGETVRCINQSLALKYRMTLELIEECTGKKYSVIHMIGGGIQSKMLCQMTANAAGRKVIAGPIEATALGNIAVQMVAMGMIGDINEAKQIIARSEQPAEYLPEDAGQWEEACERYKKILQ